MKSGSLPVGVTAKFLQRGKICDILRFIRNVSVRIQRFQILVLTQCSQANHQQQKCFLFLVRNEVIMTQSSFIIVCITIPKNKFYTVGGTEY